jgi:hypothetical protein
MQNGNVRVLQKKRDRERYIRQNIQEIDIDDLMNY